MEVHARSLSFSLQSKPPLPYNVNFSVDASDERRSSEGTESPTTDSQKCQRLVPSENDEDFAVEMSENTRPMSGSAVLRAAVKLQKVYRSYRTRRKLADSAVVAEELWWQAIDFARLSHRTISFFSFSKEETPRSRWSRVTLNASKVGKGLLEDVQAQKLAFQHWIEAIDPHHRYGHNLRMYYEEWCKADAGQPFFFWLDVGDGKKVDLEDCPKTKLRQQCVKYLGPQEREHYEYIVDEGKIVHKQTGDLLDTSKGSQGAKWIFVMSSSKKLYAGKKKKGRFHHSSFLAGGVTLAAGRLAAELGILQSISAYSGHYHPSDDSLDSLLSFLGEKGVILDEVQIHKADEDYDNYKESKSDGGEGTIEPQTSGGVSHQSEILDEGEENGTLLELTKASQFQIKTDYKRALSGGLESPRAEVPETSILRRIDSKKAASSYQLGHQVSLKWTTGSGPRIGCVADYPLEVRQRAMELVNLSPKALPTPSFVG